MDIRNVSFADSSDEDEVKRKKDADTKLSRKLKSAQGHIGKSRRKMVAVRNDMRLAFNSVAETMASRTKVRSSVVGKTLRTTMKTLSQFNRAIRRASSRDMKLRRILSRNEYKVQLRKDSKVRISPALDIDIATSRFECGISAVARERDVDQHSVRRSAAMVGSFILDTQDLMLDQLTTWLETEKPGP